MQATKIALVALLMKYISAASVAVKAQISKALGIVSESYDSGWLKKVKDHLEKYPLSYTTVTSILGASAPQILPGLLSEADEDARARIEKVISTFKNIPANLLTGGDGNVDTVWNVAKRDFSHQVELINRAKATVDEASYILGITQQETVRLAALLRAIEPEFEQLYVTERK